LRDGLHNRPLTEILLGNKAERRWGAPYRVMHRADLQHVLSTAVAAAGCTLSLGAEITAFDEIDTGVRLHIRGGNAVKGSMLIGADGLRSTIAAMTAGPSAPATASATAWRALLPAAALDPGFKTDRVTAWLGPDAHLVGYPLRRDGALNLVAVVQGPQTAGPLAAFDRWNPALRALLRAAPDWQPWPLLDRAPTVAGQGRVVLIGDAAHPIMPHLAQGAALAIEDAAVLALRLAEARDPVAALRRYERERATRIRRIHTEARQMGELYQRAGIAAIARDTALSLSSPERLMARLDWIYGWKPPRPA